MNIDEITPGKGKRALILGGSRSGKSTLLDHLLQNIVKQRPQSQSLLLDSKPRFRAELERIGPGGKVIRDADRYYNDWEKGPVVPGSYRADIKSGDLKPYWKEKDPCRIVILQTDDANLRPRLLEISNGWFEKRSKNNDRVFVVDELLDYYHGNGVCISRHNVPLKVNRAGGERGFSGIYGAQRPKGIPVQITEELSDLYLFHLRFESDMKYLYENGVPINVKPPKDECEDDPCTCGKRYTFRHLKINPGGQVSDRGLHRLIPSPSYLAQLSDT
jgi:energy-coupling factor transporter ATP-binding protein EcfA2